MCPPSPTGYRGNDLIGPLQGGEVHVVRDLAQCPSLRVDHQGCPGCGIPFLHTHHATDLGLSAIEDGGPSGLTKTRRTVEADPDIPVGLTELVTDRRAAGSELLPQIRQKHPRISSQWCPRSLVGGLRCQWDTAPPAVVRVVVLADVADGTIYAPFGGLLGQQVGPGKE